MVGRSFRYANQATVAGSPIRLVAIDGLGINPGPTGSVKLAGRNDFRIRVGDYRIVYTVDDAKALVIIARIAHRRDINAGSHCGKPTNGAGRHRGSDRYGEPNRRSVRRSPAYTIQWPGTDPAPPINLGVAWVGLDWESVS